MLFLSVSMKKTNRQKGKKPYKKYTHRGKEGKREIERLGEIERERKRETGRDQQHKIGKCNIQQKTTKKSIQTKRFMHTIELV